MDQFRQITKVKDIYVINLKHRDDRKKAVQKELKKLKTKNYEIFPAIYGTTLEQSQLDQIEDPILNKIIANLRHCHEELPSFNAIGAYMSHIEICKKVSKLKDNDRCLILEDDVKLENNTVDALGNVWKSIPDDYDVLMLGYIPIVQNESEVRRVNQFLASEINFWDTHAYILTGRGAKKILKEHDKIRFQYHAFLRSLNETNKLKMYFLLPPLIKTRERDPTKMSDVQTNNSPNLKMVRFNNNNMVQQ